MRLEVSAGLTLKKNKGAEWRLTWGIKRKKMRQRPSDSVAVKGKGRKN